ncbi:apyrase [Salvia divinorum]|uniref:Apyrase n=1 Tax=Salvia divinorum TaxID=28513 RepID=A0ABD1IML7_SALDI
MTSDQSLLSGHQELAAKCLHVEEPIDPCTPREYASEKEARRLSPTTSLVKKGDTCLLCPQVFSYRTCYISSSFIPKLQEFHSHFKLIIQPCSISFLFLLIVGAGEEFCSNDWSKLTKKYSFLQAEDLIHYCWSSAYIVAMLHDSLKIVLDDKWYIFKASSIGSWEARDSLCIPLDWVLGAFVLQSAADLDADWLIPVIGGGESSHLSLLIGIFLMVVLVPWFVVRRPKPQLKMIYALEKGKYITMFISRYS